MDVNNGIPEPSMPRRFDDHTAAVPNVTPTEPAPWAWSTADVPAAKIRQPLPRALKLLLSGVLVGAFGLAAFLTGRYTAPHPVAASTQAPTSVLTSTVTVSASPAQVPASVPAPVPAQNTDELFLQAVRQHMIAVNDPGRVVNSAHIVCDALGNGTPRAEIVDAVMRSGNPPLTDLAASNFVSTAVQFYCPQYGTG